MAVSASMREVNAARDAVIDAARKAIVRDRGTPFVATLRCGSIVGAVLRLEAAETAHEDHVAHNDQVTSQQAARAIMPSAGSVRRRILERIETVGPLCDRQLERHLGRPHSTVSAARNHLCNIGYLTDSGERWRVTRQDGAGIQHHIQWKLTGKAQIELARRRAQT